MSRGQEAPLDTAKACLQSAMRETITERGAMFATAGVGWALVAQAETMQRERSASEALQVERLVEDHVASVIASDDATPGEVRRARELRTRARAIADTFR